MKSFEALRYIRRWKYLVIAVCILGVLLVYRYAMSRQLYTAQTVVRYSNSEATNGMTPSGDPIDVTEIYSSNVITGVLEDLGLDTGADSIRSKCQVEPIIPEDEIERKEAILKEGGDYTYSPTDYLVTFKVGSEYSKEYAANVLDSMLKNYFVNYGDKYINQTVLPNNASNVKDGSYDYIESAEILDSSATDIYDYLYDKKFHYPYFRSASTGYTFNDLYEMYGELLNYDVPELCSKILNQKVSKNQDVLIKDYQNRINQYNIELTNLQEKVDPLYDLISRYSMKSKEGIQYHYGKNESTTGSDDYILKDVYDENGETRRVSTETTYDALINQYVSLEIARQYTQVDMEHKQMLLDTFNSATPADDAGEAVKEIEEGMDELIAVLDEYYKIVEDTVDEFNQYMGATNITTLTSVNVSEKINVKLYMLIAVILFLVCGCLGAIFLGRIQDFIEFLLYADRKTRLPNRAKCDAVINSYEAKPLADHFTFILIRLDILKQVNSQVGRTAGDTLLAEFGRMLSETAKNYGFVGYNGSDQFMCLFDNCSQRKAEMFILNLSSAIEHYNSQNPQQEITFSYAIEESSTTGIYEARGLIARAFKDINIKSNNNVDASNKSKDGGDTPKKPDDDPDDTPPTGGGGPKPGGGTQGPDTAGPAPKNRSAEPSTDARGTSAVSRQHGTVKRREADTKSRAESERQTAEANARKQDTEIKAGAQQHFAPAAERPAKRSIDRKPEKNQVYRAVTIREETIAPQPQKTVQEPSAPPMPEPIEPPEVIDVPIAVTNVTQAPTAEEKPENPYAPKARPKRSYRSRTDESADLGSYAPKNRRSRS